MNDIDRRTFLLGAAGLAGGAGLLAACGDTTTAGTGATPTSVATTTQPRFEVPILAPAGPDGFSGNSPYVHSVPQRVAYVLHDGVDYMRASAPASLRLDVFFDDEPIAGGEMARRDDGIFTPYFSVPFTPPAAGVYTTVMTWDGEAVPGPHQFRVVEPGETTIPQPGGTLPRVDTPTFDDARGVDPVCTRAEPCPFHSISLAEALAAGDRPTVLSIATPGFCQTAICGPVIDLLIDSAATREDLYVVHAEVYVDPQNDPGIGTGSATTTDIVDAFLLPYEPVLLVADADGTIVRRLDAIYDGSELSEALALV